MTSTIEALAVQLARALEPLRYTLTDPESAERGLNLLGWEAPPGVEIGELVAFDPSVMMEKLRIVLGSTPEERQHDTLMAGRYAELVVALEQLVAAIGTTASKLEATLAGVPDYLSKSQIIDELPRRLVDVLVAGAIGSASPTALELLRLLGLVRQEVLPADPTHYQVTHVRTTIEYERLATLVSDPLQLLVDEYQWGTEAFAARRLLQRIAALALAIGFRARSRDLPPDVEGQLVGTPEVVSTADPSPQLLINLSRGLGPETLDLGLSALRLRPSVAGAADAGIAVLPYAVGSAFESLPLTDRLAIEFRTELDIAGGVMLELRPAGATVQTGVVGDGPGVAGAGELTLALRYREPTEQRFRMLALPGGTLLEVSQLFALVGVGLQPDGAVDPRVEIGLAGGRLVLSLSEADGFLSAILAPEPLEIEFDLVAGASGKRGVYLGAGAGFQCTIRIDLAVGPLFVTNLDIGLRFDAAELVLALAVTGGVAVGPFAAVVAGIGVEGHLRPGRTGNLGNADLTFAFKPPNGLGLAINAQAVSGGGFLLFDPGTGQYTGVFELTIAKAVSVKVVGLISTKLPDGRPGFALLIVITADGFTPIQLGMGFVLTGVGGLLALNRTVDVDAVRGGLKNGLLDSVLFVKDPVANAGRLISTLNRVFPQAPDRLLIGPVVTIGWGSPPIITARVAVLLEIPDPLRLIVLATVSLLLPDGSDPIVQLRVDAVGVLDLKRGELSLDASIYDSRLWKFSLTGDMAVRIRWGQDRQFILAVGGFHPRYEAPTGLRKLERVALALTDSDNPRLRIECYLAVTSNTIQFGGRVELYAAAFGFEISGMGGVDALVQWFPFMFMLDVYVRVSVKFLGATILAVAVELGLSGPNPWRARGRAEVQFLFIRAEISFDLQFGEALPPEPPEEVDLAGELWRVVRDPGNWGAALAPEVAPGVTLRAWSDDGVLAHPLATISMRQRVVPLDAMVSRVGARVPRGGPGRYRVEVTSASTSLAGLRFDAVTDWFAMGNFQVKTDDERLSQPSFTQETAGYVVSVEAVAGPRREFQVDTGVQYESLRLESLDEPAVPMGVSSGLGVVAGSTDVDWPQGAGVAGVAVVTR